MDMVDTFNHLIPSDQLEDSLTLGQNLESEASDEFGTNQHLLGDSLKNMLSDKDPMLGSASTQFHILDNEDGSFDIADTADLEIMSKSEGATRGRLGGPKGQKGKPKGGSRSPKKSSCAVEQEPEKRRNSQNRRSSAGSKPASSKPPGTPAMKRAKKQQEEPTEGQEDQEDAPLDTKEPLKSVAGYKVGPSMNPVVVLKRLTVTVGGYKIELLPGPSKAPATDSSTVPSLDFPESTAYTTEGLDFSGTHDETAVVPSSSVEAVENLSSVQDVGTCCTDAPSELGPYVNPNEVQDGSGMLLNKLESTPETEQHEEMDSEQPDSGNITMPSSGSRDGEETVHPMPTNKSGALGTSTGKESKEQKGPANKKIKSKSLVSPAKHNNMAPNSSNRAGTGLKTPLPNKTVRSDTQNSPSLKVKPVPVAKRRAEHLKTYPPSKMQRMQEKQPVKQDLGLKSPDALNVGVKRPLLPNVSPDGARKHLPGMQAKNSKSPYSQLGSRPQNLPATMAKPVHPPSQLSEEDDQEKLKAKKLEKVMQRQRSKSTRSLSLDEPQLFIPDNAPVVKKEAHEAEDAAESEAVWDPSKHCGFCKKPHSNRFMVGCGRCDDWFHGECVGLDLAKAQQMEQEDQEYVCLKCCAEEDKKVESETDGPSPAEGQAKLESQENKSAYKHEKLKHQVSAPAGERHFRKHSGERKSVEDPESRMVAVPELKSGVTRQSYKSGESAQKSGAQDRQGTKKTKSPSASKIPSVEQIRKNVRESLKDILLKRLNESDLKVSAERASHVATKTEKELFAFFRDTDSKYKSKYRSLMFNLKDAKNNVLFKRVLKGEISPHHLIRMSPEELASKELAAWRQRENRHTIEMIEKEQREADRRPITKITHKGEIEIENQETVNEPEVIDVEPEPPSKVNEEPEMAPQELEWESTKDAKDTTAHHKTHLFDLNCKICTGRMVPPVEDTTTKVVKVATTVARRQSSTDGEAQNVVPSLGDELSLSTVEEILSNPKVFSPVDERSSGKEDETTFLARLESLWKGFVNMPSVAKFVTKAYPVSGALDHLTEDLPDSIQVGGRISPQTVWDYVEKIRASGTKELCLIRFTPVTEEDEISYTLLYAYFSSRRRYGVVANNMKQVKDMYLIPLGSSEKIPHQLVPFDGPGLGTNRPNILLGLIIRQRVKRDFGAIMPVDIPEASIARLPLENRAKFDSSSEAVGLNEKDYLNTLKVTRTTETVKLQQLATCEDRPQKHSVEEEEAILSTDASLQEAAKPLRFLPGVLVGCEGQDATGKSSATTDVPQSLLVSAEKEGDKSATAGEEAGKGNGNGRSPVSGGLRLDRFIIKKKEPKPANLESQSSSSLHKALGADDSGGKGNVGDSSNASLAASVKEIPRISREEQKIPVGEIQDVSSSNSDCLSKQKLPEVPVTVSDAVVGSSVTYNPKSPVKSPGQPVSRILKTSMTSSTPEEHDVSDSKCEKVEESGAGQEKVSSTSQYVAEEHTLAPTTSEHTDELQTELHPAGEVQSIGTIISFDASRSSCPPTTPAAVFSEVQPAVQVFPPAPVVTAGFPYQQPPAVGLQAQNSIAPPFPGLHQQAIPGFSYSSPPPVGFPLPGPSGLHMNAPWPPPVPPAMPPPASNFPPSHQVLPGLPLPFEPSSYAEMTKPATATKEKGPEQEYSDPWERQPKQTEADWHKRDSGDNHGRRKQHSESHHERKSRHHEREHGKHRERSHSRERRSGERHHSHEKHKDERRHRSHSDSERHPERRKDRHHDDENRRNGGRDKIRDRDKDRHRRESDYDRGKRS
ncbi:PHD finger protein 3 isoform X2 [Scleropages formosus]|uniref:PHD finger protein 3 n=1 Tax=Scleropages formosus TaxID=113540 RepID=A0A8C9V3W0_SCLFO|nr:PHD finger protein 3 isoform X2 [Scleropages formosus]